MSAKTALLAELFARQVEKTPFHAAIRHDGLEITYVQLQAKAHRLAALLQSHGVARGALVGICGDRSADYIVAMLATVLAGGAYLPIDKSQPRQRIDLILKDAKPRIVLAANNVRSLFDGTGGIVIGLEEHEWEAGRCDEATLSEVAAHPDDLVYVMYTSGSTGTPKGVAIPQRGVIRLVHGADYTTFGPNTSILQISPLTFDASTFEVWGSLLNGGCSVLMPHQRPSLQQIEEVLVRENVTTLFLTTALFAEIADRRPLAFRQVREVLTGGETIPASAIKRVLTLNPNLNVIACYGPTECTTFTTTHRYRSAGEVGAVIPLGEPIAETHVYCLREDLSRASVDEEGDLYVGGSGLAVGYLNRPDLTAQAFIPNPFHDEPNAKLYHTGDRAVVTSDGSLLFRGRRDGQVKLRGFRVELGEIETALQRHPSVQAAHLKIVANAAGDKALVAYAVPSSQAVAPDPKRDDAVVAERTEHWKQVYSKLLYKSLASASLAGNDPTLNTAGWRNSFDGRPIGYDEMQEQVGQTVERILAFRAKKVLEIGCGTGMLLFRIAPHCESYLATDFSPDALEYVHNQIREMPWISNVTLLEKSAHELPEAPDGGFDLVILNSVTEHFPSVDYLAQLLDRLPSIVRKGGHVFVGDNRSFTLLPHFHASVQLARSSSQLPVRSLALLAEQAASEEEQLTIDPYLFASVSPKLYSRVSLQFRRGVHHNELTAYRYDATLETGVSDGVEGKLETPVWQPGSDSIESIRRILAVDQPGELAFAAIPNIRLKGADQFFNVLRGGTPVQTAGALKRELHASAAGEDPEDFWRLGDFTGYDVQVIPTRDSASGSFDAVFRRNGKSTFDVARLAEPGHANHSHQFGNDPLLAWRKEQLARQLRKFLEASLPEYAVPSFFVLLPRFPLNANGKVDSAALPLPARLRSTDSPSGASEETVAEGRVRAIWEDILGIRNISLDEQFFEIGGDSLKAVRVAADASQIFNLDVSPALLFEAPSIRGFARLLDARQGDVAGPVVANSVIAASRGKLRRGSHAVA